MPVSLNTLNTVVGTKATVTDFSVTQNTAGAAALSYDNGGAFSYTPPDVSTYIDLTNLQVLTAAASGGGALTYNNTNGNFTFTPADVATLSGPTVYEDVNGSTSTFTIKSGHTVDSVLVFYNGICLVPTTDYTVSGTTLTTTFTPVANSDIVIRYFPI